MGTFATVPEPGTLSGPNMPFIGPKVRLMMTNTCSNILCRITKGRMKGHRGIE